MLGVELAARRRRPADAAGQSRRRLESREPGDRRRGLLHATHADLAGDLPPWSRALASLSERLADPMPVPPRATYRLQLRGGMDFARARRSGALPRGGSGVSHVYLSPPFTARPGSTHGYDVVDPNRLDPELGGEEGFMRAPRRARRARARPDPRHRAQPHGHRPDERLVVGRAAAWPGQPVCRAYFDIDFAADPDGKLVLPVLGAPSTRCWRVASCSCVPRRRRAAARLLRRAVPARARAPASGRPAAREILDAQPYRLVYWREGAARRNYRRFFNIDQLAGAAGRRPGGVRGQPRADPRPGRVAA